MGLDINENCVSVENRKKEIWAKLCSFAVGVLATKGHAFANHEIFTRLRGVFGIQLNTAAFQLDKKGVWDTTQHWTKLNLVVIVKQLYDDPGALAIVLQGNHSHDVCCIFCS